MILNVKKVIKLVLLICCMGLIFFFSSQINTDSSASTSIVVDMLYKLVSIFSNVKYDEFVQFVFKPVRKLAHFSEFCLLGILIYLNVIEYRKNKTILLSIVFAFIYAISDEVHQLFVPGRAFAIMDILIDTSGAILGIFVIHLIVKKWLKKS